MEMYQQPGTVLVLARRKNSGSDAIKNNCIPYAVKGKGLFTFSLHLTFETNTCILSRTTLKRRKRRPCETAYERDEAF